MIKLYDPETIKYMIENKKRSKLTEGEGMIQLGDSGCAGLETGFVKIASLGPAVYPANVCKHEEGEVC